MVALQVKRITVMMWKSGIKSLLRCARIEDRRPEIACGCWMSFYLAFLDHIFRAQRIY